MPETPPRPRSVTLGCLYGGIGGVMTAILMFEALSSWGSIEMQEALNKSLADVGLKTNIDDLLPTLRWFAIALLIAAIAAAVFSVFAARGDQTSRIGLTVLAVAGGVISMFAGVAGLFAVAISILIVFLLWNEPARSWFAVVNGKVPLQLGAAPALGVAGPVQPSAPTNQPAGAVAPPPYVPAQAAPTTQPGAMPKPVKIALLTAGIGSFIGASLSALLLLVLVVLRDEIVAQYRVSPMLAEQVKTSGISPSQLVTVVTGVMALWLVVSILTLAAAALAATRRRSGWLALLIATLVTAGAAAIGLPLGLIWLLGAIVVIVQLTRPEAKAWFQ
ncbi:MAG TPA: hypothetical protein PLQ19_03615 [Aeromicrobium sp.]|nr:hypothetical protein [Aeromicrobium sp.]